MQRVQYLYAPSPPSPLHQCTVSATALVSGATSPASNTLKLKMPATNAPTLTSAMDTGSTTGKATAVPPTGVTYDLVS